MNVLGGATFGHLPGFILISLLTATGSTLCYLLSIFFLSDQVEWLKIRWPVLTRISNRLKSLPRTDRRIYLVSMRLFPLTPNWLLNVSLGHLGIGIGEFFTSVLVGLGPYNFLTAGAGDLVAEIESVSDIVSGWRLVRLALMAVVVGGIALVKRRFSSDTIDDDEKERLTR
jgi:uncharacterized membrane protein YdjX (TVP38/TMEM64 family)